MTTWRTTGSRMSRSTTRHPWTIDDRRYPDQAPRWIRGTGGAYDSSCELIIGNDGGGLPGHAAIWGHNLGPDRWSFGGDCVHPVVRAFELGDLLFDVLCHRSSDVGLDWSDDRSRHADLRLSVRAQRSVVCGRLVKATFGGYDLKPGEEFADMWGWSISLIRPDGGREWGMRSWCTIREREVARSYAERIAIAWAGAGFGMDEVMRDREAELARR